MASRHLLNLIALAGLTTPASFASLIVTGNTLTPIEGTAFSGTVATFTDTNLTDTAAGFSAVLNWGDASPTSFGTVTGSNGSFTISGSHTFAEEGSSITSISITGLATGTGTGSAFVADAQLNGVGFNVYFYAGVPYTLPVGVFSDGDPNGTTGDYSATIHWGDGNSTAGTIGVFGSSFTVSGSHVYALDDNYSVTATITDQGGQFTTLTGSAQPAPEPATYCAALAGLAMLFWRRRSRS